MMPIGMSSMPARTLKLRDEQEVDVGLLEFELAGLFEPFDKGVLELELADEADAVGELWVTSRTKRWKSSCAVLRTRGLL